MQHRTADSAAPPYRWAAGAAACVLALYLVTLSPTTAMWDTSEYIAAAKVLGLPHPPGYHAFLGILHGVNGRADLQVQGFETEKAQFPESTAYIEFLLKNARK